MDFLSFFFLSFSLTLIQFQLVTELGFFWIGFSWSFLFLVAVFAIADAIIVN